MEFRTQGYNGYAVKYSPFFDSRLCVAASANYGIVGNGRVYVLQLTPQGIRAEKQYVHIPEKAGSGLLIVFLGSTRKTLYTM